MTETPQAGQPTAPQFSRTQAESSKRAWYTKKRFIIPVGTIVALIAIGALVPSEDETTSPNDGVAAAATSAPPAAAKDGEKTPTTAAEAQLYPNRPDRQKEDQERTIGQEARLSGYTALVSTGAFRQSLNTYAKAGYVVADVSIENRDKSAQSYNTFDWRLQTPTGQVIEPTFVADDLIGSGDLVQGGKVTGKATFEVGNTKGDYYLIYKPDPYDAARGIWKITV